MKYLLLLSLLLVVPTLSFAESDITGVNLAAGGFVPYGGKVQDDKNGGSKPLSFHPMAAIGVNIKIANTNLYASPQFGFVTYSAASDEVKEDYSKSTVFLLYDVGYLFFEKLFVKAGLGTFMTKISGSGGTVEVRNGATGTVNAYRPSGSQTSYNTTVNLGVEYRVLDFIGAKFETYVAEILSSDSRGLAYSLSIHGYF